MTPLLLAVAALVAALHAGAPAAAAETLAVEVRGADYRWTLRYPGEDGVLGTPDDPQAAGSEIHLPAGRPVRLELRSDDFIYLFDVPDWSLREAAIPDLDFQLDLGARPPGTVPFVGDQMCGYAHATLHGSLVIEEPERFRAWLAALPRAGADTGDDP